MSVSFTLIAAVAANGVIGREGDMPWHLPEDLTHFKQTTMGHPVVMGRTTYESIANQIDGPLPGRQNIVLTTRDIELPDGAEVAGSVEDAIEAAERAADKVGVESVYIVGGQTVYEQFFDRADAMVLTQLEASYEGDTRFPEWDSDEWEETERDERDGFAFVTYKRRDGE